MGWFLSMGSYDYGQDKERGIFDNYFRGALVAVLMFDLTRALSIGGLDTWYNFLDKILEEKKEPIIPVIEAANKKAKFFDAQPSD